MSRFESGVRFGLLVAACAAAAAGGPATAASGSQLPARRGYEMVSEPDKNGGDVFIVRQAVRAADDGSAATFDSVVASADPQGTGTVSEFVSRRTGSPGTRGWAAHAILPRQPAMNFAIVFSGLAPLYQNEFSADLSKGVVLAWSPLTDAPNVATATNLYLRTDLLQPGPGTYTLVTDCPLCSSPLPSTTFISGSLRPRYVGASSDFGHLLFESKLPLAAGADGSSSQLFEWDHAVVRLAGVLPDGTPAGGSTAGGIKNVPVGTRLSERSISADGSKIFFTDLTTHNLYMRVAGTETVQLNASERSVADAPQGAQFQDASTDGSRVFFTSQEALTDDAAVNNARKLYMYDTTKPASDPHNLVYVSAGDSPGNSDNDVVGVIGASADGSTVYFLDSEQLVTGKPGPTELALFGWHDGTLSYVAPVRNVDGAELTRDSNNTKQTQVAANGDLLFSLRSSIGPTGYNQTGCGSEFGACRELYLYHLGSPLPSCVSCDPSGAPPVSDATTALVSTGGNAGVITNETRAITDDGSHVFFSTADALVPEDVNGVSDAYEYDANIGQVHLISSGTDTAPSYFVDATPSGHDVFFYTRERLVGWDVDQSYDLYDARVDGGFPDPPPAPPVCAGDRCQGAATLAPSDVTPGSETFVGSGNVVAVPPTRAKPRPKPRHCPRGHVRRRVRGHVKCVKRRPARKARKAGHSASKGARR